ncbi:MAG TPA: FecR domain-containing protein, partial [Opitutaceae bacterium]
MSAADDERRIGREAAEWRVKQDRGLTPSEQDAFLQWLAASPEHRAWFARQDESWRDLDLLASWRPEHSEEPNPDLLARPARLRRGRWLGAVLALAASIAVAAGIFWWTRPEAGTFVAPVGGYERRTLADGSVVELNRGASLEVRFTPTERRVRLVEGEAQFKVTKNPQRPFIVTAGGVSVRAVGTAFNVRLGGGDVEVLVTEGAVRVNPPAPAKEASGKAPSAPAAAAPASEGQPLVTAGQRTVVSLAPQAVAPAVVPVTADDLARLLAWQPQLLDFSSAPLSRVVTEFNRRNHLQIVVADEELGRMPIVASF